MINLQVKRAVRLPVEKSLLLNAAQSVLEAENTSPRAGLSIVIGNDTLLKQLNHTYRNIDAPTDVLSFPSGETDPDTHSTYIGDVIISLPRAQDQALAGGHSLADELQLLVVHGTLHLLGYDHLKRADKKKMQAAQDIILTQLGVKLKNTL
ncbi:MAG: rRNA maturation RNase YbeY [Chloroflexi bacterium RBG_16_54_11]|nr:MAG: rRNA maturation RNase YbeY [Chloroflexi bacterium RBG_16_54_11]